MSEKAKETNTKNRNKILSIVYIGVSAALIAICSWIQIPLTVPITLQTMGVCLVSGLLGLKRGTLATLVYIVLGAIGVPVFAGFAHDYRDPGGACHGCNRYHWTCCRRKPDG